MADHIGGKNAKNQTGIISKMLNEVGLSNNEFYKFFETDYLHRSMVKESLKAGDPVSISAVREYGLTLPDGYIVDGKIASTSKQQPQKPKADKPKWTHTDRRGETDKPKFEQDVEPPKKPKPEAKPYDGPRLSLGDGTKKFSTLPNKADLINEQKLIRKVLGTGHIFDLTGRTVFPMRTLRLLLDNPQLLTKLSADQRRLIVERIEVHGGRDPSELVDLRGDPLSNEAILERLIQGILTLADAAGLRSVSSALRGDVVDDVRKDVAEEAKDVPPEPGVEKTDAELGSEAAFTLLDNFLKEGSTLTIPGAVSDFIETELANNSPEFAEAFLTAFYYNSPRPKTRTELRLAAATVESRISTGLTLKAMEGAALAESEQQDPVPDDDDDDGEPLEAGSDGDQLKEYDKRFADATRKLLADTGLQGAFGARFILKAIKGSSAIRELIREGASLNNMFLNDPKFTKKQRDADIETAVEAYLNSPDRSLEERYLLTAMLRAGLKPLKMFDAYRDLSTRFHNASSRPASKVVFKSSVAKGSSLKIVPYSSNSGSTMVASLATVLTQKLSTREEALKFFALIKGVQNLKRDSVYNFWSLMLSEPAEVLEFADSEIGAEVLRKKPGIPKPANELGPLFSTLKDPNVKSYWGKILDDYLEKVKAATDPADFRKLSAEISRKMRSNGLSAVPEVKAKGMTSLARIAQSMPESEAPASYRRPDGTHRANVNSPDQITHMVGHARNAGLEEFGPDYDYWVLKELDMVDATHGVLRRAITFENLLEEEHVSIHRAAWDEALAKNQKWYDAWAGPLGDKTSVRTVTMPLYHTYEAAVRYYNDTVTKEDVLTEGERNHEAVRTIDQILEAGNRGEFDNSPEGLVFEIVDRANRLRIMHAIHGDFSKFGDAKALTKRASTAASSGVTMTKEGFGDTHLNAIRIKDPAFVTTALQLAIDRAQAQVDKAKGKPQALKAAQALLAQTEAAAKDFLEGKKGDDGVRRGGVESTDGHALIMPQARDRIQWAYGPLLTQEKDLGSLKVAKTIHTGHEGLDKQGASILTPEFAAHADGSAYQVILDAVARHLQTQTVGQMDEAVARNGGQGANRVDVIFFSSGDKAKSGKEYDLMANKDEMYDMGPGWSFPTESVDRIPVSDFYWLLSAGHSTQATVMQMPVQTVAVLSGIPGAFNDLLSIQDAAVAHARKSAVKQLQPKNVISETDHALAPLAHANVIPFDNVFMSQLLSKKQTIKLSKIVRPEISGNQLVEAPIAAPPEMLMDYYKVSQEETFGLWDPDPKGDKVRLARADFNSDGVRFSMKLNEGPLQARTVAEAEALLRDPMVFPYFMDMFDIPRADLKLLEGLSSAKTSEWFAQAAANPDYEFRSWDLETDGEFISVPGEPVLIQRVPSDNVYSTSVVRAGKRVLTEDGQSPNVIMTSQGVQIGSGADFDIDKRFVMSLRRTSLQSDRIVSDKERFIAEKTYRQNAELPKTSKTNVQYDLSNPRWAAYNRFLLGLVSDFEDVNNFDAITYQLDHDLIKDLTKKAVSEKARIDESASWEADLASVHGAARLYKLNSVGKKGLGRSATSMFSAGIMHGLGYGVTSDRSFGFSTDVEGTPVDMRVKVNRLAGDRTNFHVTRSMIGLVMNLYTDHTKMQVIDKLGGDEITASLFATMLYMNRDLVSDAEAEGNPDLDGVTEYGEVMWRVLESPEVQAWADLSRLKFKLNLTKEERGFLDDMENSKDAIKQDVIEKLFKQNNPGVIPNTAIWELIIGGSQEMLDIERLFRGYRNPMPTDSVSLFNKRQAWTRRAIGLAGVEKVERVWEGTPSIFQLPAHVGNDHFQTLIHEPFAAIETAKIHRAFTASFDTASIALSNVNGLYPAVRINKHIAVEVRDSDPAHRRLWEAVRDPLKKLKLRDSEGQDVSADQTGVGVEKSRAAINRLVFATAVMTTGYPFRQSMPELEQRLSKRLGEAYAADRTNLFLTQGVAEKPAGEERFEFSVPSGTSGIERSEAELKQFHEGFDALPEDVKLDLLMYAVAKYGLALHTSYGSYLPYISPDYLTPYIKTANELTMSELNEKRATIFAHRASRATGSALGMNLKDIKHPVPEAEAQVIENHADNPDPKLSPSERKVAMDAEAVTATEAKALEDTEGEGQVENPSVGDYSLDYELHGASKADWDTYFTHRHVPLTASTVGSWTLHNFRNDRGEVITEEDSEFLKKFKEQVQPLMKPETKDAAIKAIDKLQAKVPKADTAAPALVEAKADAQSAVNVFAGTGDNAHLSNFAVRPFTYQGEEFASVEQYFQLMKFRTAEVLGYEDQEAIDWIMGMADKIHDTRNGATLKRLGNARHKGVEFDASFWAQISDDIMKEAMIQSFSQNPYALEKLRATGTAPLTHKDKSGREQDGGRFSRILMEVREELSAPTDATAAPTAPYSVESIDGGSSALKLTPPVPIPGSRSAVDYVTTRSSQGSTFLEVSSSEGSGMGLELEVSRKSDGTLKLTYRAGNRTGFPPLSSGTITPELERRIMAAVFGEDYQSRIDEAFAFFAGQKFGAWDSPMPVLSAVVDALIPGANIPLTPSIDERIDNAKRLQDKYLAEGDASMVERYADIIKEIEAERTATPPASTDAQSAVLDAAKEFVEKDPAELDQAKEAVSKAKAAAKEKAQVTQEVTQEVIAETIASMMSGPAVKETAQERRTRKWHEELARRDAAGQPRFVEGITDKSSEGGRALGTNYSPDGGGWSQPRIYKSVKFSTGRTSVQRMDGDALVRRLSEYGNFALALMSSGDYVSGFTLVTKDTPPPTITDAQIHKVLNEAHKAGEISGNAKEILPGAVQSILDQGKDLPKVSLDMDPLKAFDDIVNGEDTDPDNNISQAAFFTKLLKVDASTISSQNGGREMLLKHSRITEQNEIILAEAAKRWIRMTNSRGGDLDKIKEAERAGEAMLKALTVMYEAGIRTESDLQTSIMAQVLWDKYPASAAKRPEYVEFMKANPGTVKAGDIYYWDSPDDLIKQKHNGKVYWVVPKSKRRYAAETAATYWADANKHNAKIDALKGKRREKAESKRMHSWETVMTDYARTLDDAASRMNKNVGYDWMKKHENRVFHVLDIEDRGTASAPNKLGGAQEDQDTFLETSSYSEMSRRGLNPRTFNVAENFAAWLRSTSEKARLVGVLRSSTLMTDINGVPGLVMGSADTTAGEKLTPYDRKAGFLMLNNLRKKLSEHKSVKLPPLNPNKSPWVQANELATAYPEAMAGLGYVPLKSHALGPNVDQVWVIQGTLENVVKHVSYTGFKGRLQEAKADKSFGRTLGWGVANRLLSVTKLLKGLNVGFSAFHHLALAESAVANVGLTFKNPIFHLGNYWMAGRKGLKMYREMTANPEIMGKWAGRGLKASTLPLDALHYQESSKWLSRAGHAFKKDGKGLFKKTKAGDVVGNFILGVGNLKRQTDNLLWHGMVPVMKVHMAEQMFEKFRADPRLKHLTDEKLGHDIAKYVNDALGGQEWEQYMHMNPLMQDWANMVMFAPDWTLSALNVSGMSKAMGAAFGLEGPMNYSDDAFDVTKSAIGRHRWTKYLPGFFMNVLVMPPVAIQAMIFTMFGSGDDGDEMWTWNNEKGKKFLIDFTPILRHYHETNGNEVPDRRAYLTPGKQLREIGGWLQHPAKTLYGKSSNVVRMANLIVFRSKTHPFSPQPWTVDREDVAMEAVYSLLPFVASGWMNDAEVPLGMRPFLTVTRGASEWTLAKRASEVYLDAASGKGYQRMSPERRAMQLEKEFAEIWRAAELNGVDVRTVQTEGRREARAQYNQRLVEEMSSHNPDSEKLQEHLLGLAVLQPNYRARRDSLRRTIDYRVNRSERLSKEEKARLQGLYDSYRFRTEVRNANDTHADTWGRRGGVTVENQ